MYYYMTMKEQPQEQPINKVQTLIHALETKYRVVKECVQW